MVIQFKVLTCKVFLCERFLSYIHDLIFLGYVDSYKLRSNLSLSMTN